MELYRQHKKIFLFGGIFAALFIIYELFFSGGSAPAQNAGVIDMTAGGLVSQLSVSPADAIVGVDLLNMLRKLQSLPLDPSIFKDPVFMSLKDKSLPLVPQPLGKALGRRNPFYDFGGAVTTGSPTPMPPTNPAAVH